MALTDELDGGTVAVEVDGLPLAIERWKLSDARTLLFLAQARGGVYADADQRGLDAVAYLAWLLGDEQTANVVADIASRHGGRVPADEYMGVLGKVFEALDGDAQAKN